MATTSTAVQNYFRHVHAYLRNKP